MTNARKDLIGALAAGFAVIGFCFLLLWHDPLFFWKDDYEISILPVFADVARSWSEGHLPLLSPYSWVCSNLAGEFQYGTFSLFVNAAVILIWKFSLGFAQQAAALSMAHLFALAAGAFLLARGRDLSTPLAMIVALVTALNGWIICWGASDWFGALGAFAWLPWAWWGMERALDRGRTRWRFLWPAPFVYLLVTGGFPYTVLMLGAVMVWLALKSLGETGGGGESLGVKRTFTSVGPLVLGVALGLGLAAPAWLALLDYVHGSARGESVNAAAHWQWLVPPAALPGFVWPAWTVAWRDFSTRSIPHPAVEMACGTLPPIALLAGFIFLRQAFVRRMRWELALIAGVLIISMLPSANVFRWSFRWLPLLHLALALTAAEALHQFRLSRLAAWFAAVFVFTSLLVTYFSLSTKAALPQYNFAPSLTNAPPLVPARLYLSVYPPPETAYRIDNHPAPVGQVTRPGSISMWAGVPLINGYSPIRGAGVGRAFAFYTHGEIDPAMADYLLGYEGGPNGLLARIGVDGIIVAHGIAAAPQPAAEWIVAHDDEEGRVYHRSGGPLPPIRSLDSLPSAPNEKLAKATIRVLHDARNKVVAEVDVPTGANPALLLAARPYFDGYRASLDGKKVIVDSYQGLVPMIKLPPGTHGRLVMIYRPWWLIGGGMVAVICALVMVVSAFVACRVPNEAQKAIAVSPPLSS